MSLKLKQYKGRTGSGNPWDVLQLGEYVHAFGIQAPQGTKFKLNGGNDEIIIGATGIYELDLRGGLGIINKIVVLDAASFDSSDEQSGTNSVQQDSSATVLIDILYEDGSTEISTYAIEEAERK